MSMSTRTTAGFTAVELLITLFVAAAFIVAGYQLFNLVIKDGGNTRAESSAGNTAYDYLRRYSDSATNPCTPSTPLSGQAISIDGVSNASISVSISCPETDTPTLSKIEAVVTYGRGADAQIVKHATYVDKSRGATPNVDVTDGLVGRWRLNGNGINDAGGAPNGILNGTTPSNGQNGLQGNALLLNGTSDSIEIPGTSAQPRPTQAFTLTAWANPNTATNTIQRKILGSTQAGGYSLMIGPTGGTYCPTQYAFEAYVGGAYKQACATTTITPNVWAFVVGVYDGASVKLYVNGTLNTTTATSGAMTYGAATVPICIGEDPGSTHCTEGNFFGGSIDDVRIYNRALSASEILQLYNGGAM